jgi:hypothetical protein
VLAAGRKLTQEILQQAGLANARLARDPDHQPGSRLHPGIRTHQLRALLFPAHRDARCELQFG